ncbi:MAG: T9SS type A sorting domain-containing protein, partial [candidate division Zixibacteria bacterium]|nr:T9SS type A sorting domain-containing protein [candidate division Zixibacteria bacterium]
FVIAWQGAFHVFAQRYNSTGTPLGSNFKVDDTTGANQDRPAIAMDGSGKFVITWQDDRNGSIDIYAQNYNANGTSLGKNYLVPNAFYALNASFAQLYPAVGATNSDIYFTWQDNRRAKGWDIYAKVVDWNWTDVGDEQNAGLPNRFELSQNHPNPFNPTTTIPFRVGSSWFMVHSSTHTSLIIYNILGQKVRTLVDEEKLPGSYQVIWDGRDDSGKEVTSGIYFYQLKTENYTETKKMVLLR